MCGILSPHMTPNKECLNDRQATIRHGTYDDSKEETKPIDDSVEIYIYGIGRLFNLLFLIDCTECFFYGRDWAILFLEC